MLLWVCLKEYCILLHTTLSGTLDRLGPVPQALAVPGPRGRVGSRARSLEATSASETATVTSRVSGLPDLNFPSRSPAPGLRLVTALLLQRAPFPHWHLPGRRCHSGRPRGAPGPLRGGFSPCQWGRRERRRHYTLITPWLS